MLMVSRQGSKNRVHVEQKLATTPTADGMEFQKNSTSNSKRRQVVIPMQEDLDHAFQKMIMNPYQRLKVQEKKLGKKKISEMDDYFDKLRDQFPQLIEKQEEEINRMQYHCLNDAKEKPNYDISSDECVENATVFQFLLYKQRMRHMEAMWRKAFIKAKAAGQFIKFIRDIQDKIYLLGISYNIKDTQEKLHIPFCIIPPDSKFSQIWSLTIAVLLIYTATYMPYKTCFVDTSTTVDDIIDWIVDSLFMFDILVNFLQATENTDGTYITIPKIIARNYLKSWFAFDLVSVIPFQLIEKFFDQEGGDASSYNQLIRLARLPRLYRMTKLMRLFKVIKSFKKIKWVQKILKSIKINSAIQRMIQGMITAVLLTHIFACFWFLTAKFYNFSDDTWVARLGLRYSSSGVHYIWALHWATQTITTVGYGDVPAFTNTEIIFSFIWMLIGVVFYSFIIGNFSSLLAGSSHIQKSIQFRVQGLSELARKAQIPFDTSKQIKQYIESNVMAFITQDEDQQLIQTLPPCLRDEILLITYGEMIDRIDFLKTVEDHEFMWKLLQSFVDIKFNKGDVLYWRGDDSDSMYFILSGRVKLYTDGNPFIKYQNGECFGDQDMLLNLPRDSKAVAITHLHLKALNGEMFEQISKHAQETCLKMIVEARQKRDKHFYLIRKLNQRLSRKNIVIQEDNDSKIAEITSKDMSNSMHGLPSPNLFASLGLNGGSNRSLLSPFIGDKRHSSPVLTRINSDQHIQQKQNLLKFKMNPMETIQESDIQSLQGSRKSHSQSRKTGQNDNQKVSPGKSIDRKSRTPIKNQTQQNSFSSMAASLDFKMVKPRMTRLGSNQSNKKIISRRHIMMDSRLKKLSNMNDNRKEGEDSHDLTGGLMDKFWKQNVPIFAGNENDNKSAIFMKSMGRGTDDAISEKHEESSQDDRNDGDMPTPIMKEQSDDIIYQTPESKQILVEDSVTTDSNDQDKKIKEIIQQPSFKDQSGFENLRVNTISQGIQPYGTFEELKQVAVKDTPSSSFRKTPSFGQSKTIKQNSFRNANQGSSTPGSLQQMRRINTLGSGSTFSRRQSFINSVPTRVNLNDSRLSEALQVSSRVKLATRSKQLQQLGMRCNKQGMDQLGKNHSYFYDKDSISNQTFGGESQELDNKLEELNKLELEEINEDDGNESEEEETQCRRRTILDKVVGNVFGKSKQNLYEMFPSLAVITVPKMPIITPKGDEIILRKKYNNNMTLLNEAFEQKKELFNNEMDNADLGPLMENTQEQDYSPTVGSQTPINLRKSISTDSSPNAIKQRQGKYNPVPRKISGETESLAQKKPSLISRNISQESLVISPINKHHSSTPKQKSMQITVQEVGENSVETIKRTNTYLTNKLEKNLDSPENKTQKDSMHLNDNLKLSESNMSRSSSWSSSLMPPKDGSRIDASFHQLNGKLKSSSDLKREFVSPAVMKKLKQASRQLINNAKKKEQKSETSLKVELQNSESSPDVRKVHIDLKVVQLQSVLEESKDYIQPKTRQSNLVSIDDEAMSEVLSSYADVHPTSQSHNSSMESAVQKKNDLDMEHRYEILQLLKNLIDKDEGFHTNSPHTQDVLKLFSNNADQELGSGRQPSGRIEYIGNESMKSVVRFNMDSYLIGLNTFEVISMFDHVQQAMSGMKKKLVKVSQHLESIEKRQTKLDINAEKMIEKMKAYRDLKKEVANLNRTQLRDQRANNNYKQPKNMKVRRGQSKTQGQFGTNLNNSNITPQKQDSQADALILSVVANDIPETSSLPIQQPAESSLALAQHEVQTHQTFPSGSLSKQQQQQQAMANLPVKNIRKRDNLLLVASVEEMSAETIAKIVNRPPQNL